VLTDSEFSCPALLADFLTQRSGTYAYEFSDPALRWRGGPMINGLACVHLRIVYGKGKIFTYH
jgi:hypothetical protein